MKGRDKTEDQLIADIEKLREKISLLEKESSRIARAALAACPSNGWVTGNLGGK